MGEAQEGQGGGNGVLYDILLEPNIGSNDIIKYKFHICSLLPHLLAYRPHHRHRKEPDDATPQIFFFPLLTEETQLLLLLLVQGAAVLRLWEHMELRQ